MNQEVEQKGPLDPLEEAFLAWKAHPVTREVFQALELRIQTLCQQWSRGEFIVKSRDEEAGHLGTIAAYRDILELDYQTLQGILHDE